MRTNFSPQMNLNPLMAIGAGLSLVSGIGKLFSGIKQSKEAKKINPVFNQYQANPYAKQQLGLAQNMFNGRMAGAQNMERNIFSNQANTLDSVGRNATDASQALAAAAGVQGQTNNDLTGLQTMEMQNKYNMLGNLNQAYGANIDEGDKVYNSMLQKFQMDSQRKDALANAGAQNKYGAVNGLSSLAMMGGQMGLFGGGGAGKMTSKMDGQNVSGMSNAGQFNFNARAGASPASAFGTIPFNPNQPNRIPGLANFLNRPR